MATNLKCTFTLARLRLILWSVFCAITVLAVLGAISCSRAIGQREAELAFPEDGHWNRIEIFATAGPTPIQCPGCWFPRAQSENFDGLTPPELPFDWLATNALGPPPLWVTSDS
jgi:hypothetical protein